MLRLKTPGVYTQEIQSGVRAIGGASTAVALFIGPTLTGIDRRRIRISNYADYERAFGGLHQDSSLSYSVLHFFANGGGEAFVIRVPPGNAAPASLSVKKDDDAAASITLTALSSGKASNEIFVEIDAFGISAEPFQPTQDKTRFNLTLTDRTTGLIERFANLSTKSDNARFAQDVINDDTTGSKLVKITVNSKGDPGPQATGSIYRLKSPLPTGTFNAAVKATLKIRLRNAAGVHLDTADGQTISLSDIILFAKDEAIPTNAVQIAMAIKTALNAAIRADETVPSTLKQIGLDVDVQEGSRFIRLRIASAGPLGEQARFADAVVQLGGNILSQLFASSPAVAENPPRYRLGSAYGVSTVATVDTPSQISANVDGTDGTSGLQPATAQFKATIQAIETVDPFFDTLCLPDLVRPSPSDPSALRHTEAKAIYEEAARICDVKNAFLLIDPFPDVTSAGAAESWKAAKFTLNSEHSAIYFPNIRVDDPLEPGAIRSHPPSGAMAGIYARTDAQFGVWQAPAGTDATIAGVYGPSLILSDDDHGLLNPIGVNVIRQFPIYGTVSFGSRTVNGLDAASSDYKSVPVRRTANYILRSLTDGLRWAVHKPNGEQLWSQIRLNVNGFMQGLFRQGAFKGTAARDAYFVLCDTTTTTATDIQQGIVNVQVGFAPLRPAEFIVISLRQIVQTAG